MRILLVLAAGPEVSPREAASIPIMAPSLTLPVLAEICRRHGDEPHLLDTRYHMRREAGAWVTDFQTIAAAIETAAPDVACISFFSSSRADGFRIAELCRAHGARTIGGGVHATVAPAEFAASSAFDHVVQGEAEAALPALLDAIAAGRSDPKLVTAPPVKAADIVVTDELDYYRPVFAQYERKVAYFESTRGCYKRCRFCEVAQSSAGWRPVRRIPLESALETASRLVTRYGVDYLLLADSIATIRPADFIALANGLWDRHPDVALHFNSTVDRWCDDIARACRGRPSSVWFGFESGSQRVLDEVIDKGTTVDQALAAADSCAAHDVPSAFNLLVGLPGETERDYEDTVAVLERCARVYPNPNIFTPLPGTELYRKCLAAGTLRDPADFTIWDVDRITAAGHGPVLDVDYDRVLRYHEVFRKLQDDPNRALSRTGESLTGGHQ